MSLERISVTIPEEMLKKLDYVARRRFEDRSVALRQLVSIGLKNIMLEEALDAYVEGKISLEKAAEMAEVSIWKFFDLLKEKKIPLSYRLEDAEKEIKDICG